MKGNFKSKVIISFAVCLITASLVSALFCLLDNFKHKSKPIQAAHSVYINESVEYTALFKGNIICSVEKVKKNGSEEYFLDSKNVQYSYDNISYTNDNNETKSKYVVADNSFVKIDNENEVVAVTLGQYVYEETDKGISKIQKAGNSVNAGMTYLSVSAKCNGYSITGLGLRPANSGDATCFDFLYTLDSDATEGHYEFSFTYYDINKSQHTESIEFYLIKESSYTAIETINSQKYYSKPTILVGSEPVGESYYVGQDGDKGSVINYPTLCYNYRRYHLSFTHTTNRKVTKYDVTYNSNCLIMTVSNSDGNYERKYYMQYSYNNTHIVNFLLTKRGTYQFKFEYIYCIDEQKSTISNVLPEMNLDSGGLSKQLTIHGFELQYSKVNYVGAELKYLKLLINNEADKGTDLVVLNGYNYSDGSLDSNINNISQMKNQSIDMCYDLAVYKENGTDSEYEEYKWERTGAVVVSESENPLINSYLSSKKITDSDTYFNYLWDNYGKFGTKDNLRTILDSITNEKYIKTNQGSLWFEYNDELRENESFYFYSSSKLTVDNLFNDKEEITAQEFNNRISFNKAGYYLVFIKYGSDSNTYSQIFAFRYVTNTVNINVVDDNEKTVTAGGYTNTSVMVSWQKPDIFEKKLTPYVYQSKNVRLTQVSQFTSPKEYSSEITQIKLGEDVVSGSFVQYMIKIRSEGESATYKIFTIDKQDISGVELSAVSQRTASDGSLYFEYALNNGKKITVQNSITNSYASLSWSDKASGAEINATYSFIQFLPEIVADSDREKTINNDAIILTNYKLGSEVTNITDYSRPDKDDMRLNDNNVLSTQGIYLFTLLDEAGNNCSYMFIIDATEVYFKITSGKNGNGVKYASNQNLIYQDDVNYNVGNYKGIKLNLTKDDTGFENIFKNNFPDNYYAEKDHNNKQAIKNLFVQNSGTIYLRVKNEKVYDVLNNRYIGNYGQLTASIGNSTFYHIYVLGQNCLYSGNVLNLQPKTWKSNVHVEINPDNSQGYAYASDNDNFRPEEDSEGRDHTNAHRLYAGSSIKDSFTGATSLKYVYFAWRMGTGTSYQIDEVKYTFYSLNLTSGEYEKSSETTLYATSGFSSGAEMIAGTDKAIYKFGVTTSNEGLYVVYRKYAEAPGEGSKDTQEKYYYFIVDRNEIRVVSGKDILIGGDIAINMLEKEAYSSFEKTSTTLVSFNYTSDTYKDDKYNLSYFVSLNTNKVPLTISLPKDKYYSKDQYDSTKDSNEDFYSGNGKAGQLNVKIFYIDSEQQIASLTSSGVFVQTKIFDSSALIIGNSLNFASCDQNGKLTFNVRGYLAAQYGENSELYKRLVADSYSDYSSSWLSLAGQYIMIIEDNVLNATETGHRYVVAFTIKNDTLGPQLEVKTGYEGQSLTKEVEEVTNNYNYYIVTNKDYVQFDLLNYVNNLTYAQVDNKYLEIAKDLNGQKEQYIKYNYSKASGYINYANDTSGVVNRDADGNVVIKLPTNLNNLTDKLTYTITIRYYLKGDENNEKYLKAYYRYEGKDAKNRTNTYTSTYIIEIDRRAPYENVDKLIKNDKLITDYFDNDAFTYSMHTAGTGKVYSYEYRNYYESVAKNTTDKSKIYYFKVTNEQSIATKGLAKLYYREVSDLSMPVNVLNFNSVLLINKSEIYFEEFGTSGSSYEILEVDKAGNICQYVVLVAGEDNLSIPFKVSTISNSSQEFSIGLKSNEAITIFNIDSDEGTTQKGDSFYKISLKYGKNSEKVILTTAETQFDKLSQTIADAFKEIGYANYTIVIYHREFSDITSLPILKEYQFIINYFNKEDVKELNVQNIYFKKNGTYYIDLAGANVKDGDILYYAKTIEIETNDEKVKGKYSYDSMSAVYTKEDGSTQTKSIECNDGTTYSINITDLLDRVYRVVFNTSGKAFYKISFDCPEGVNNSNENYVYNENRYYAYTSATMAYDLTMFNSDVTLRFSVDGGAEQNISIPAYLSALTNTYYSWSKDSNYATLNLKAQDNQVIDFTVVLDSNMVFYFNINRYMEPVLLTQSSSGAQNYEMGVKFNETYTKVTASSATVGLYNLSWNKTTNSYFMYSYILHRQKNDFTYEDLDLSSNKNYIVATPEGYNGNYKFEIKVYSATGTYLGNKVYAFEIRRSNNQLYYVRDNNGNAIEPNSTFTFDELGVATSGIMNGSLIPLYVVNQTLTKDNIIMFSKDVKIYKDESYESGNLHVYTISVNGNYDLYLGILKIVEKTNFMNSLKIEVTDEQEIAVKNNDSKIVVPTNNVGATIKITGKFGDSWQSKNVLILDVFYGDKHELVQSIEYKYNDDGSMEFEFLGNGEYHLRFRDLAGNIHLFGGTNNKEYLTIFVMREITLYVNNQVYVENAYYNNAVEVRVYAASMYYTGSIHIDTDKTTLNGKPYTPSYDGAYHFTDYGSYKVKIDAEYIYNSKTYKLSKTIEFTIINEDEVFKIFDLSVLAPYKITKCVGPMGDDITNAFVTKILNSKNLSGMVLNYESIMADDSLDMPSGKLQFQITYTTKDLCYPTRSVTLIVTLNNEEPEIECSLKPGETTKKGFNIKFNPGIIYDQIGDSYILINDDIIYKIDRNSIYSVESIEKTFKNDGDGDYYIKLISSSGSVLKSYKITIKEPLNTWAIIIIVVVCAVAIAITVVIIVLRHRMKIR